MSQIDLPPLRDRTGDIPLLVAHFLDRYAREMGKSISDIDSEVMEIFAVYQWPGNIRELQNVIKRSLTMATGTKLTSGDLPDALVTRAGEVSNRIGDGFFDLRQEHAAKFERDYLANLLQQCAGDVSQAARKAQLPRGTFYRFLKKYSLKPDGFRD